MGNWLGGKDYFDSNLERVNETKNFYKHMASHLLQVLATHKLDTYRLWTEGMESWEAKKKEN